MARTIQCCHIRYINPHEQMKFPVGNRQPVRGVFRCILGQDNIQCAVRIQLEVGAVVDAVAVDGIVNEEIILSVGGGGPGSRPRSVGGRVSKWSVYFFSPGQRCAVLIHRWSWDRLPRPRCWRQAHQRCHRAVGVLRAEVADGLAVIDPPGRVFAHTSRRRRRAWRGRAPEAYCIQRSAAPSAQESGVRRSYPRPR